MSTTILAGISLMLSTLLCFFTNSWVIIWVLLEVNTLSFCTISSSKPEWSSTRLKESMMKYLVVQSIASAILITASAVKETGSHPATALALLTLTALLIKMAAAPFHNWFIQASKGLGWLNNKILFTWQKLLPVYLVIFQTKFFLLPFIAGSVGYGSIFLINKKSLKEILAISSIFNLGWMLLAVSLSLKILLLFSAIYWMSLLFFIEEITKSKTSTIDEKSSKFHKVTVFVKTANLAGVPPLMLFMAKWLTLSSMLVVSMSLLATLTLILSSINAFAYLRVASLLVIQNSTKEQKTKAWNPSFKEILFLSSNLLLLQMFI